MPAIPRVPRATTILSAAIAALALLLVARTPVQAATTPGADAAVTNVISVAMGSLNQWEGECFPWVRRVMAAATGRTIGWDYRLGYLEAGAVEVPLDAVQEGDVIQMADDAQTGPSVSYSGLHTAIVMENHGGGVMTVIDSNSQWDGVVRIRTDYNPAALAARYTNITARAYRFPGVTAVPAGTTPVGAELTVGGSAIVSADGDCLRLRSSSGTGGVVLICLPDSTVLTVLEGVEVADGRTWRQVNALGRIGWVAEEYLRALGTGAVTTPPPPTTTSPSTSTPPATTPVSTSQATGTINGQLPAAGGVGLVVWSGGATSALAQAAEGQGCALASIWSASNGGLVGYTHGAPSFVNRAWQALFPGDTIPATSALVVICDGSTPPASTPPAASTTPPAPATGGTPPGPAGND